MTVIKKRLIILGIFLAAIILLIVWGINVVRFNQYHHALDDVPVEDYPVGTFVSYDHNYAYGEYPSSFERVCVVNVTAKNDGSSQEELVQGLYLGDIMLCGLDYYCGQNWEFYDLENPEMDESMGITMKSGEEHDVTIVFNLIERYYTAYNWKNIDKLRMMLYLTAYPVQKNIILQEG